MVRSCQEVRVAKRIAGQAVVAVVFTIALVAGVAATSVVAIVASGKLHGMLSCCVLFTLVQGWLVSRYLVCLRGRLSGFGRLRCFRALGSQR